MKTIEINEEQYDLIEQEKEHVAPDMSTVELISEALACYAMNYQPDNSFTPSEARSTYFDS